MNETLDDLESLLEEQSSESGRCHGRPEQKKAKISQANSFEVVEDTFGCKNIKEKKALKISKTSSFDTSEDTLGTKKFNEKKTPKISKTSSFDTSEDTFGTKKFKEQKTPKISKDSSFDKDAFSCKNALDHVIKPLKTKNESKFEGQPKLNL